MVLHCTYTFQQTMRLLDLPNELLLQILGGLSQRDLLSMSYLSRRLRSLALPIFLAAHGIEDPERETSIYVIEWNPDKVSSTDRPDALSGLTNLSTLSRVEHFRCFFQDADAKNFRNTFQLGYDLPHAVSRVAKFIQPLKHVGKAEIYLVWDPYFVTRERTASNVPVPEIRRWTNAFGYLLNLLVVRGCTSLTVQYPAVFEPAFSFKSTNAVRKAFSYLSHNVLRRDDQTPQVEWELPRPVHEEKSNSDVVDSPTFPSTSVAPKHIQSLSIHSPVLLLPPFTNWTLSLLRAHPHLTSISFAHLFIAKDAWSTLLPLIAAAVSDKLVHLSFFKDCPNLDVADLFSFLSHLPNLRYLSIDRSFRYRLDEFKCNKPLIAALASLNHGLPKLLQLQTLRAPVEFLSLLLESRSAKDPILPRLKHITVFPTSRLMHPPNYIASSLTVNSLLDRISAQERSSSIVFSLDAQMDFTDFGAVARWIELFYTHGEFRRSVLEAFAEPDVRLLLKGGQAPLIAFERITHVVLYHFKENHTNQTAKTLCLWLKLLFPNLEQLTFTCHLEASPQQDITIEAATVEALVQELGRTCPKVRVLVVGQERHGL